MIYKCTLFILLLLLCSQNTFALNVERGKLLFKNKCSSCHLNNSTGNPNKIGRSASQISNAISNIGVMSSFSTLSSNDLKDLEYYLDESRFHASAVGSNSKSIMSNKGLFHRCYIKITQEFHGYSSSYLTAIRNGADPIDECLKILDLAKFVSNSGNSIGDTSNIVSRKVLSTFHNLHYSWFNNKYYKEITGGFIGNAGTFIDTSSPALFFTKSLFDPAFKFKDIFSGEVMFRAERTNPNPEISAHRSSTKQSTDFVTSPTKFSDTGDLLGISLFAVNDTLDYGFNSDTSGDPTVHDKTGTLNYTQSWGGGVLGSQSYMLQNSSANNINSYRPNGGVVVNRQWGGSVVKDFLCRELPLIRELDAQAFVDVDSSVPFRKSLGCVKCHVSMDRLSALTRNIGYTLIGAGGGDRVAQMILRKSTKPASSIFPTVNDKFFYLRPPTGFMAMRNYNGNSINIPINDVGDLGSKFGEMEAPYICVAKRYYKYFTGIDAEIGDIGDPDHPRYLRMSKREKKYRNIVISLGKKLKLHQDPRKIVEEILRSDEFKMSDYGLGE